MPPPIPPPDPLGLPVPASLLLWLKGAGFFLHLFFMNLWVGGLPAALVLYRRYPEVARRLLRWLPFAMAFGINAGLVPLLFVQTLYPQFFYPATILQAWFWFLVIPLLLVAYYALYLAAFERWPRLSGAVACVLLGWIGLTFSAALSLTTAPEHWWEIFLRTARGGAVHGGYFYLRGRAVLRYGLVLGMALGTVAAVLAVDGAWRRQPAEEGRPPRHLVPFLFGCGLLVYGLAGLRYLPAVRDKLPPLLGTATALSMPLAAGLAVLYWRWPGRASSAALLLAQLGVLLLNTLARQQVQVAKLRPWLDLSALPVRGEWGSVALFGATLAAGTAVLAWLAWLAWRHTRPPTSGP
ncbi:MAG: hypothetical protein KatS3mg131_3484 [Candidatus Tectimicrobiota bacterium]|nr:MAG: hypothetical protein KatS3mg131_3484 [Candidatus Tectomicrobia bacterium]